MTENIFTVGQILYRYKEVLYASFDSDGDLYEGSGRIDLCKEEYRVTSVTPKGAWVSPIYYYKPRFRFILAKARKRFAHANEKDALESYIARQKRRIAILEYQIDKSRRGMNHAKNKLQEHQND